MEAASVLTLGNAPRSSTPRSPRSRVDSEDPHLPEGRVDSGVNSHPSERFFVFIRGPVGTSTIYIYPDNTVSDLNDAFYNEEGIEPELQHLKRSDGLRLDEADRHLTS